MSDDTRLRRLKIRSWRRGTKEMDLILGPFADAELGGLSVAELDALEATGDTVWPTELRDLLELADDATRWREAPVAGGTVEESTVPA